jgi:hypothetical protein
MKTRSITVGVGIALMIGMLTAGTVNIVEAERQDRRRSHDRKERLIGVVICYDNGVHWNGIDSSGSIQLLCWNWMMQR